MDHIRNMLQETQTRARIKHQSQRESMLTLVRSLISTGKIEEAKVKAKECRGASFFEDVAEFFKMEEPVIHCEECGQRLVSEWISILLSWSTPECPTCKAMAEKRATQKVLDEHLSRLRDSMPDYLRGCGVPRRFLSARIEDFPPRMSAMCEPESSGWFITGPRGTGKTHLAVALIREHVLRQVYHVEHPSPGNCNYAYVRRELDPIFVPITELLLEIRDTFHRQSEQETEKEIIDHYSRAPLLVLDDMGAEKSSEWSMQTLYTLIDRRYRDEMRTVITSNVTLDELSAKVDDRIASRIAGMCRIQALRGKDRRLGGLHVA